jgi:LEA14-like dessication related protein
MKKFSYIFLLFLIAIFFLTSCGNLKEPDFRNIDNVWLGQIGGKETTLHLDVHYFNPNKTRIVLKKAEGDVWLDGVYAGKFDVDSLVHIAGNSEFRIPVLFKADMKNFLINSALAYADKQVLIKVEGKAKVGKAGIFVKYPVHYEGKQNLRELLKQN